MRKGTKKAAAAPKMPERVYVAQGGTGSKTWYDVATDVSDINDGATVGIYELVDTKRKVTTHGLE
jgi:hypothetical protein